MQLSNWLEIILTIASVSHQITGSERITAAIWFAHFLHPMLSLSLTMYGDVNMCDVLLILTTLKLIFFNILIKLLLFF